VKLGASKSLFCLAISGVNTYNNYNRIFRTFGVCNDSHITMNEHETDIGEWRSLGGAPVGDGNDDADAVFAHVSDLHGQLTPRYQGLLRQSDVDAGL